MLCKKCGGLVEPQYEQIGECENCFADVCGNLDNTYKNEAKLDHLSGEEALALPISDLELSVKTENRLSDMGFVFIKDLVIKTEEEIRRIPNFGDMTLTEIKRQLQIFGLALKNEQSQLLASPS